jgi:inositol phosphorylceramide mannosyltransferase catalytic subunit
MLSNNILGSAPNHPFWKLLTDSLISYNYNYIFPYMTISYASGQWFLTEVWERYHQLVRQGSAREGELLRVMMDDRLGRKEKWVFFTQERGGTWKNWDNAFFLWVGDHLALETCLGIVLIGGVWWVVLRLVSRDKRSGSGAVYGVVKSEEAV